MQNASSLLIGQFNFSIQPANSSKLFATRSSYFYFQIGFVDDAAGVNTERLLASQAQFICIFIRLELQRQDAHTDQVGPVDAFLALGDHGLDALKIRAFSCPVA